MSGPIYRGIKAVLPKDLMAQIDALLMAPMEESERDQYLKIAPLMITWLETNGGNWDDRMKIGRHWTTRKDMAAGAAQQGGGYGGVGMILTATYRDADVEEGFVYTTEIQHKSESEVTLKPGAQIEIIGFELVDYYGWDRFMNELPRPIRATAGFGTGVRPGIPFVEWEPDGDHGGSGRVGTERGPVIAYRGFGSWGEARDSLVGGRWESKGMFTVSGEGDTQMALDLNDVLRQGKGIHRMRGTGFLGFIEADIAGLPFRTFMTERGIEFNPVDPSRGTIFPDTGLGLGVDGGIPLDQILRVVEVRSDGSFNEMSVQGLRNSLELNLLEEREGWEPEVKGRPETHRIVITSGGSPKRCHLANNRQDGAECGAKTGYDWSQALIRQGDLMNRSGRGQIENLWSHQKFNPGKPCGQCFSWANDSRYAKAGQSCGPAAFGALVGMTYRRAMDYLGNVDAIGWGDLLERLAVFGEVDFFYAPDESEAATARQWMEHYPRWTGVVAMDVPPDGDHVLAIVNGTPEHSDDPVLDTPLWAAASFRPALSNQGAQHLIDVNTPVRHHTAGGYVVRGGGPVEGGPHCWRCGSSEMDPIDDDADEMLCALCGASVLPEETISYDQAVRIWGRYVMDAPEMIRGIQPNEAATHTASQWDHGPLEPGPDAGTRWEGVAMSGSGYQVVVLWPEFADALAAMLSAVMPSAERAAEWAAMCKAKGAVNVSIIPPKTGSRRTALTVGSGGTSYDWDYDYDSEYANNEGEPAVVVYLLDEAGEIIDSLGGITLSSLDISDHGNVNISSGDEQYLQEVAQEMADNRHTGSKTAVGNYDFSAFQAGDIINVTTNGNGFLGQPGEPRTYAGVEFVSYSPMYSEVRVREFGPGRRSADNVVGRVLYAGDITSIEKASARTAGRADMDYVVLDGPDGITVLAGPWDNGTDQAAIDAALAAHPGSVQMSAEWVGSNDQVKRARRTAKKASDIQVGDKLPGGTVKKVEHGETGYGGGAVVVVFYKEQDQHGQPKREQFMASDDVGAKTAARTPAEEEAEYEADGARLAELMERGYSYQQARRELGYEYETGESRAGSLATPEEQWIIDDGVRRQAATDSRMNGRALDWASVETDIAPSLTSVSAHTEVDWINDIDEAVDPAAIRAAAAAEADRWLVEDLHESVLDEPAELRKQIHDYAEHWASQFPDPDLAANTFKRSMNTRISQLRSAAR